jgi:hypothetical protein
MIVNDDYICTQILSVYHFLREFALSSLDKQNCFGCLVIVSNKRLSDSGAELLIVGEMDESDESLSVGNLSEVRESILDGFIEAVDSTSR